MFPNRSHQVASAKPKKKVRRLATLGLLAIAAMMLFGNLNYPLFEPVETRNAQLALTLIETGNWSAPKLQEELSWTIPPLQTWAIATSYKIFGASPWATRFPVALASMLTVISTFLIGRRLVGFQAAALASLLLLLSAGFAIVSRYTTIDATLTAATTATFLFGFESVRRGLSRNQSMLAGLAAGFGLMVNGPVILALCGPPLLFACWLGRGANEKADQAINQLAWFVVPMLIVATPWFAYASFCHPEFLTQFFSKQFFWSHNTSSFVEGVNYSQPFYYYLLGIFVFMFPVSYLLPSVFRFAIANRADQVDSRSREVGYLAISVLWIFAFFTFSSTKLPTYILPALPMLCLLMGSMVDHQLFSATNQRRNFLQKLTRRAPLELPAWSLLVAAISVIWFDCPWMIAAIIVAASLLGSAAMLTAAKQKLPRRQRRRFGYGLACVGCTLVFMVTQQIVPSLATQRSDLLAAKLLKQEVGPNVTIVFFGRDTHAVEMALGRKVVHFDETETEAAAEFLSQTPESLLVSATGPLEDLRGRVENRVAIEKVDLGRHVYRAWSLAPPMTRTAEKIESEIR